MIFLDSTLREINSTIDVSVSFPVAESSDVSLLARLQKKQLKGSESLCLWTSVSLVVLWKKDAMY